MKICSKNTQSRNKHGSIALLPLEDETMPHRNRQSSLALPYQHGGDGGGGGGGSSSRNNNYNNCESKEELIKKKARSTKSLRREPQWRLVMIVYLLGVSCLALSMFRPSPPPYLDLFRDANRNANQQQVHHPRCVRYANDLDHATETLFLEPNSEPRVSYSREIDRPMSDPKTQKGLADDSADYSRGREDVEGFETRECKAQYPWQLTSFPACNTVYEFDLTNMFERETGVEKAKLMANGFWRDVWSVKEEGSGEKRVLKTMKFVHDYTPDNYDRHRREAVAMERLTKSNFVVDIYAFCGNSALFQHAAGGDILDALRLKDDDGKDKENKRPELSQLEKLHVATQAALGVAAVHNFAKEGQATIAHSDISPQQFIKINGIYRLNDFNRARFLRWNKTKKEACTFTVEKNPGKNRSPEEYAYEGQSEKIDVYSLGNIFYMLLQSEWPFADVSYAELVKGGGHRPSVDADVWNSTDPVDVALREAMVMCHEQDPEVRASARDVENHLKKTLRVLDPGRLTHWGEALQKERH